MFKRFKTSFHKSIGETASESKAADEADYAKKISDSKQFIVSNEADNTMPATHNEVLADNALGDNCAKMQFHNSHETGSCSKTDNCDNVLLKVIDHLLEENKDLKRENAILKEKVNDCQCKADAEDATGKESEKQYSIESQRHSRRNSNSKCNAKGKNQLIKEAYRYEELENNRDVSSVCDSIGSNDSADESSEETDKIPWQTARKRRKRQRSQLWTEASETTSKNGSGETEISSSENEGKMLRIDCLDADSNMKNTCIKNYGKQCKYCGTIHKWGSEHCPAYGKTCRNCGKQNHIAEICEKSHAKKHKHEGKVKVGLYTIPRVNSPEIIIIAVYDDKTKEYNWYPYPPISRNPVNIAKELIKTIREFAGEGYCKVEVADNEMSRNGLLWEVIHQILQLCKQIHISESPALPPKEIYDAIKKRIEDDDISDSLRRGKAYRKWKKEYFGKRKENKECRKRGM